MKYLLLGLALLAGSDASAASCLLKVDDIVRLHGPCNVEISKFGYFTIGGGADLTYFAVLPSTTGEGFWNEEEGASHAHSPLGVVRRDGSCWRSRRATVCVTD